MYNRCKNVRVIRGDNVDDNRIYIRGYREPPKMKIMIANYRGRVPEQRSRLLYAFRLQLPAFLIMHFASVITVTAICTVQRLSLSSTAAFADGYRDATYLLNESLIITGRYIYISGGASRGTLCT